MFVEKMNCWCTFNLAADSGTSRRIKTKNGLLYEKKKLKIFRGFFYDLSNAYQHILKRRNPCIIMYEKRTAPFAYNCNLYANLMLHTTLCNECISLWTFRNDPRRKIEAEDKHNEWNHSNIFINYLLINIYSFIYNLLWFHNVSNVTNVKSNLISIIFADISKLWWCIRSFFHYLYIR